METRASSPGEAALPDWNAIQQLQQRTRKTRSLFKQDAIDKAIDALLDRPQRQAAGKRLADNAFANARKSLRRPRLPLGVALALELGDSGCARVAQGGRQPLPDARSLETARSPPDALAALHEAYTLLCDSFAGLPVKARRVLLVSADSWLEKLLPMPVKGRQRRNILRRARRRFGRGERDAVLVLIEQAAALDSRVNLFHKLILLAMDREPSWDVTSPASSENHHARP